MSRIWVPLVVVLAAGCPSAPYRTLKPNLERPRPIEALDTVFLEEMTWMEVRDALKAGKTTILVPTGGVEQNGPYLATGKHNYILRATTEAIARRLNDALVAPIVPFVPEGDIEPPSGHMHYPGTISLTEDTYERLLSDICASLRTHGFRHIVLLGDSGGNQRGMQAVTDRLNARWMGGTARAYFIPEYYDYDGVTKWLEGQGIRLENDSIHDDFVVTAQLMAVDPTTVRLQQRLAAGQFRISGLDLVPAETTAWGKKIIDYRAESTVRAIRKAIPGEAGGALAGH
ncbi:MAG TPA: creatininase family protein [Gemmataceae bacterium]|nr:creatininase family protein [Gemmataceae bacterium]